VRRHPQPTHVDAVIARREEVGEDLAGIIQEEYQECARPNRCPSGEPSLGLLAAVTVAGLP
jgi:hypothetical protein